MILKMRKMRILISALLAMCCVSASAGSVLAETADANAVMPIAEEVTEQTNETEQFTSVTDLGLKDDSYIKYLEQHKDAPLSAENIIYNAGDFVLESAPLEFEVSVQAEGWYAVGMSYAALESKMGDFRIGVKIDGDFPYLKAGKFKFARMWKDEDAKQLKDAADNEYAAQQVPYMDYAYSEAIDETVENGDRFLVYLTAGVHRVTLVPVDCKIKLEYFKFASTASKEKYNAPADKSEYYKGEPIVLEAEKSKVKSSHFFVGKSDTSSTMVTPQSPDRSLINYIGGGNWKTVGETIVWETPELKAGYYNIGFSFRQNTVIGGKSYRTLLIDGEVPFLEAEKVGFKFDDLWQHSLFSDDKDTPYLIYLSEGKHEISLKVTSGDIGQVRTLLTKAVGDMGDLYVDMTKITGETVDIYRDYDLFRQIGDMEERLTTIRADLKEAGDLLLKITGEKSGSNYSVINNMIEAIDQMLENKFEAHRHKSYYYSNYCSVSSVLQELRSMPLDLDKIVLVAPNEEEPFAEYGFFKKMTFGIKRFIVSFTKDYDSISTSASGATESITLWVSWGRDQAQVLNAMVERSFTPKTKIQVNIKLVNASIIQAILSGKGPDCRLQQARSEPINLAMRGALLDLTKYDDYKEVLSRFFEGADTPYWYKGGLYAIPDTQSFNMLFYRKDILAEYGIEVPKTWEEFDLAAKLLTRNNMTVCFPNAVVTDAVTGGGVGAATIYPTFLMQHDVPLYSEDGMSTNLRSSEAMEVFEKWTNYYTKMKFPISLDFYNRFRTGTTPLGVAGYSLYTTLKAAAPEIEGLWGFTVIPGVERADGTISHASAGGGTGCSILEMAENPDGAWEFLKWWTEADTQLSYSNELESILGPTGRVTLSNVEAVKGLTWDEGAIDDIMAAWEEVEEVPEYPGSYYVARSIYQAYWNVVSANKNTKDMLMKFGKEADDEIARKWKQYADRG